MLNYEITHSPAYRGHQRRVITSEIVPPEYNLYCYSYVALVDFIYYE